MTATKLIVICSTLKEQDCRVLQPHNSAYLAHHTTKTLMNIYSKAFFSYLSASVALFKHKPKDKIICKGYCFLYYFLLYLPPTQYSAIKHHIIIIILSLLTSQQPKFPHSEKLFIEESLIYTNIYCFVYLASCLQCNFDSYSFTEIQMMYQPHSLPNQAQSFYNRYVAFYLFSGPIKKNT